MSGFHIVVLGCMGGPIENNLSGYLLATGAFEEFIALDAGSLLGGIDKALELGVFSTFPFVDRESRRVKELLVKHVKGYLISHAHLDHIAGLVINSQLDEKKAIYGIDETIDNLRDHIFNGKIWPNYGSEGEAPLHQYQYHRLLPEKRVVIKESAFSVTPFLLNHPEPLLSTAFLMEVQGAYLLYFGDTASDKHSHTKRVELIWRHIAPLIDKGQLKGMMLECSYAHGNAPHACFGHLDTHMMMEELRKLRSMCRTLHGLKVVVTHRKEMLLQRSVEPLQIEKELQELNDLGVEFIFPTQGQHIQFS